MRLGVSDDWFPGGFNAIDDRIAAVMVGMGFTATVGHFQGDPTASDALLVCQRVKHILDAHGLALVQFWGSYPSLLSPDEDLRGEAVRRCQAIVRLAARLGADMACLRPTSLHPTHPWWAHADNFLPETRARLVRGLAEIMPVAEAEGIPVALECHVTTTLSSPEIVREIIEEVGSSWLKVNMDVVNFISSLHEAYYSAEVINRAFDALRAYAVAAHLKDVVVDEGHVVHISEVIPGDGLFDWDTFFRRFEALLPDGFGFIEHLKSEEQVRRANAFIRGKLAELDIPVRQ